MAVKIQGIHKRMVRFQKLTRNLFLALHGYNVHRQQRQLSQVSHALPAVRFSCLLRGRGASFQDGVAAGKGFCKPSPRNSRYTVITDLDTSKRSTQKAFFLLRRHLGNWPRGPAISMRSELLVTHEKLGIIPATEGVGCARVR